MDIDKDFIKGLGVPPDDPPPKSKMGTIDVALPEEPADNSQITIAETPDEVILAMADNPIVADTVAEESETVASISVETKSVTDEAEISNDSSVPETSAVFDLIATLGDNLSKLMGEISDIKVGISKFDGYEKAVETLKRSLAANQHNEDNIYKELEEYKKNQYYNYIRPFLEFLINLLNDMINSKKQYEDDHDEFISQHGQEVYDEIIELHEYYVQQIESQLQIQGVEIVNYEPGTPFISTEQIISKPILTEDVILSGMVGKVDSACYRFEDKVLKKAKVHVYKSKPVDNK